MRTKRNEHFDLLYGHVFFIVPPLQMVWKRIKRIAKLINCTKITKTPKRKLPKNAFPRKANRNDEPEIINGRVLRSQSWVELSWVESRRRPNEGGNSGWSKARKRAGGRGESNGGTATGRRQLERVHKSIKQQRQRLSRTHTYKHTQTHSGRPFSCELSCIKNEMQKDKAKWKQENENKLASSEKEGLQLASLYFISMNATSGNWLADHKERRNGTRLMLKELIKGEKVGMAHN